VGGMRRGTALVGLIVALAAAAPERRSPGVLQADGGVQSQSSADAPPPTVSADGPTQQPGGVGIALTGGAATGVVWGLAYLHALHEVTDGAFGRRDDILIASVSGGSLAYLAYVNLPLLRYPPLERNWTTESLTAWRSDDESKWFASGLQALDVSGIGACLRRALSQLVTPPWAEGAAASTAADDADAPICEIYSGLFDGDFLGCMGSVLSTEADTEGDASIWRCVIDYLVTAYGLSLDDVVWGPKQWNLQFTALNGAPFALNSSRPHAASPLTSGAGAASTIAILTLEGRRNGTDVQLVSTPPFRPSGARASGSAIDLAYAVTQTSNILGDYQMLFDYRVAGAGSGGAASADASSLDPIDLLFNDSCSWAQSALAPVLQRGQAIGGTWVGDASAGGAQTTDGGIVEHSGIASLLRSRVGTAVLIIVESENQGSHPAVAPLWGVECPEDWDVCVELGCAWGAGDHAVFSQSMWPTVHAALNDTSGSGLHVFRDVPVLANARLGIEAYTLEKLLIFNNALDDAFISDVLADVDRAALGTFPTGGITLNIPPLQANAYALYASWRAKQNAQELRALFA